MTPFVNEPYADFSSPDIRAQAVKAMSQVSASLGQEYRLWIAGDWHTTGDLLTSTNPSRPSEVIGRQHKATPELAKRAVEDAYAFFPTWAQTPPDRRAEMAQQVAAIIRDRKFEFDAWLVTEAGKSWPEAEADVSEAIDFCEYY